MRIVIAGGGKIGYYLVKTLLPNRHTISIIEKKEPDCLKIADELEVAVVHGDCTDIDVLSESGVAGADVFIAVTGQDEDNLIACQLAKRNFCVHRTIARVNNPKNISVFEKLGVDLALSSTSIFAEVIEKELQYDGLMTMIRLQRGNMAIVELTVRGDSPGCGLKIKDMSLPTESVLITIVRGETSYIPNGHTIVREGDILYALCKQGTHPELTAYFGKPAPKERP
jgi:trk system potassium uptake protein